MSPEECMDAVRNSALGRAAGEEVCTILCHEAHVESWRSGSVVFWENDKPRGMFIILRGAMKLVRQREDGREFLLHLADAPDVIAEGALYLNKYPATGITTEACELLLIRQDVVFSLVEGYAGFARYMYESMAGWLDRLVEKIDQLTLDDATARLVRYLFDLPEKTKEGVSFITLPVKKGDLAALLNMNQATLSRTLRRLQDDGLIEVTGRTFHLLDPTALKRLMLPPLD